jgi:hypothetical protein
MLNITWRADDYGGVVQEDGQLVGFVALEDWFEPEQREPRKAWVVQFMVPGMDAMQRALVELDGEPATDEERAAELGTKARAVVEQGAPATPAPFGHAPTGLGSNEEIRELIQLTNYALESAAGRVTVVAPVVHFLVSARA